MLRKGTTAEDGTYTYKCGCDGKDKRCRYCCGGDLAKCQDAIKTAQGQVYYGLLKTILSYVGKAMVDECKALRVKQGKLALVDIGYLSLKFGLNFKATCEWLEETACLPAGTYERVKSSRGFSVAEICEAARNKYEKLKR